MLKHRIHMRIKPKKRQIVRICVLRANRACLHENRQRNETKCNWMKNNNNKKPLTMNTKCVQLDLPFVLYLFFLKKLQSRCAECVAKRSDGVAKIKSALYPRLAKWPHNFHGRKPIPNVYYFENGCCFFYFWSSRNCFHSDCYLL